MAAQYWPLRTSFAFPGRDWTNARGGHAVTWGRKIERLTKCLSCLGLSRLPGSGSKDREDHLFVFHIEVARNLMSFVTLGLRIMIPGFLPN